MPVYIYHCDNCGIQFEKNQKFSDEPLKRCPQCGEIALHKVYSPVSVIYKGSGFYSTDHHSSSGTSSVSHGKKEEKIKAPNEGSKKSTDKNEKNS
ncbi:MAG TPA: zinc ribbon domain-containing protein [Anaerolineae bacterium]|nr:zinc ribbon domain-containing protein [Anaerolineae bacterium]